jgi:hypothetical protein
MQAKASRGGNDSFRSVWRSGCRISGKREQAGKRVLRLSDRTVFGCRSQEGATRAGITSQRYSRSLERGTAGKAPTEGMTGCQC